MSSKSQSEFAKMMMKMAQEVPPFTPIATYYPEGDCIEFFATNDSFYSERIDDLVTVYYSQDTREIVGSLIKGVREFCDAIKDKLPGFAIEIKDKPVRISHLFQIGMWTSPPDPDTKLRVLVYEKLIQCAEESKVEAEMASA